MHFIYSCISIYSWSSSLRLKVNYKTLHYQRVPKSVDAGLRRTCVPVHIVSTPPHKSLFVINRIQTVQDWRFGSTGSPVQSIFYGAYHIYLYPRCSIINPFSGCAKPYPIRGELLFEYFIISHSIPKLMYIYKFSILQAG